MKTFPILLLVFAVGLGFTNLASRAEEGTGTKVLYFTKSSGFEHSVVKREGHDLSHSEKILKENLGLYGIEVVCSKDGGMIGADSLKEFDTVIFYTSGNLFEEGTDKHPPISPEGLPALLDWIRGGGGFIGIHAATDSQRGEEPTEYTKMIGAAFLSHGKQEYANVKVVDPKFPGMAHLPSEFRMIDEWYLHNQVNAGENMRVLAVLETGKMEQEMYNQHETIPLMWANQYGKGRVFYTALGHREDVWEMPLMQGLIRDALAWTSGKVEADASPNFKEFLK